MTQIVLDNKEYKIVDTIDCITLADSFVKNKIGFGHGEAKLYVGNENEHLLSFFKQLDVSRCCFKKTDFAEYLQHAKNEFIYPQQSYVKKNVMYELYENLYFAIDKFIDEILYFDAYRVNVAPPRIYINSKSNYYDFLRSIGLPNISYISILKLIDNDGKYMYYFKIFVDYRTDLTQCIDYTEQEQQINNGDLENAKKLILNYNDKLKDFKKKLINEGHCCPFTKISDERLLVATHIKPWVLSEVAEKLDYKNVFLFTPTYAHLFEKGFISFEDDKTLMVSPWISSINQERLEIYNGKQMSELKIDKKCVEYLSFHRDYIFKY